MARHICSTGEDFLTIADGYRHAFPDGDDPLRILARLTEELGEVASAVAHLERHGAKVRKHGEPSLTHLAREIEDLLHNTFALVRYYAAEQALDDSVSTRSKRSASPGTCPLNRRGNYGAIQALRGRTPCRRSPGPRASSTLLGWR